MIAKRLLLNRRRSFTPVIMPFMQKFIVVLVLFLGVVVVMLSFGQLEQTLKTLRNGDLRYLFLAIVLQVGWFLVVGLTYRSIYKLLGMNASLLDLTLLAAAANFVNIVMPIAGVGGVAVFVHAARKKGQASGKVTLAAALFLLFDQAAFLAVLALGMIVLIRRNDLGAGEITAALIFLGIASLLATTLYLGTRSVDAMGRFLARLARLVNLVLRPFLRRDYLREERAHEFAHEMADGLTALPARPRGLLLPLFLAFFNKSLLIGILWLAFLSFNVPYSIGTVIGGFAIGYLFIIVSPTPSGIGVMEGVMALGLKSLRVNWHAAVILTLAYRALTFWLPLAVGGVAFRYLHLGNDTAKS